MSFYLFLATSSVVGLLVNIVVQIAGCRWTKGKRVYYSILFACIVGAVVTCAITAWACHEMSASLADTLAYLVFNSMIFVCFAYGWFQFVSLNLNSLRIRMVKEIYSSSDMAELYEQYNPSSIIKVRLERLTKNGHLVLKDGRYYDGKPLWRFIAKVFEVLKTIILGVPPELK